jgi:hypothetical protein
MFTMLVLGAVLVVLGIAGSVSACVTEDRDLTMALVAGLSLATGAVLLVVGGARRGYHYRPEGVPPEGYRREIWTPRRRSCRRRRTHRRADRLPRR